VLSLEQPSCSEENSYFRKIRLMNTVQYDYYNIHGCRMDFGIYLHRQFTCNSKNSRILGHIIIF
jgi:hypothetical protein